MGGPSIVWNRLAVKNKIKIIPHDYPDAKAVKTNLRYDASSLYLYCMGQDMPTGYFHRRRAERNFRLEKSCPQSQAALDWLNYVSATEHIFIQHAGNSARGKKSEERKYPWMDSMPLQTHSVSLTVFFFFFFPPFFLFFFHACACIYILDCKSDDAKNQELAIQAERTQQKHAYIRQLGYNLVVIKECHWRQLKQQNERVKSFSHHFRHSRARENRRTIRHTLC